MSIARWIASALAIALFPIASISASAKPRNAFEKDYWVVLPRDPGIQQNINVSDEVGFYQAPIGITSKAIVSHPMSGVSNGVSWNVSSGDVLLRHFSENGVNEIFAYCTEERKLDRNIKSVFGKSLKICFTDTDNNQVFDSYILDGYKYQSESFSDDTLSPFTIKENIPLCEKCYIEFIYYNGGSGSPNVAYQIVVEGKALSTPGMIVQSFEDPSKILKLDNWQFVKKKNPLPQQFDFGFARITIKSFDQKSKVASLDLTMPTSPRIFLPRPWSRRITIYY